MRGDCIACDALFNLLLAQSNPSHLKCNARGVLGLIRYSVGSSVRVCVSDFQIKGNHLLPVNFGTGLDLHGVYILNL